MSRPRTDAERIWDELCHPPFRLHSHEIRSRGLSGNPSQRIAELEDAHAVTIPRRRERRNGRPGILYFHPDHPPAGLGAGGPSSPRSVRPPAADTERVPLADAAAGPEPGLFALAEAEAPTGSYRDPDAEGPVAA